MGISIFQPGSKIGVFYESWGTQGPFALTENGEIVAILTAHQVNGAPKGASLYLIPEFIPVAKVGNACKIHYVQKILDKQQRHTLIKNKEKSFDSSFRIKRIETNFPMVLKKAIIPTKGQVLIKSGARTGITEGAVKEADTEVRVLSPIGEALFKNQIETEIMGEAGDSGSFVLTKETFEPVGLLFATTKNSTFHNKLTNLAKIFNLRGFFAPIDIPQSFLLRHVVSLLIPDGFFEQTQDLKGKNSNEILEKLGVIGVKEESEGFLIEYKDLILMEGKHVFGDEGSLVFSRKNELIGLAITGNKRYTLVIKIKRILEALNLRLIKMKNTNFVARAGYWKTRCPRCKTIKPPKSACIFCKI